MIPMKNKDTLTVFLNNNSSYINCLNNVFHSTYGANSDDFLSEIIQVQASQIRQINSEPKETLIFLPYYQGCNGRTSMGETWIFYLKHCFLMSSHSPKLALRKLEGDLCSSSSLLCVPRVKISLCRCQHTYAGWSIAWKTSQCWKKKQNSISKGKTWWFSMQ